MEHDKITVVLNDVSPLYYKDQKLFLKPSEAEAKILAKCFPSCNGGLLLEWPLGTSMKKVLLLLGDDAKIHLTLQGE